MKLGVSLVRLAAVVVSMSLVLITAKAADEAAQQQAPADQSTAVVDETPVQSADVNMEAENTAEECADNKDGEEAKDGKGQKPEASDENVKADAGNAAPAPAEKPAEAPAEKPADDKK